jgi:hypothetical protein
MHFRDRGQVIQIIRTTYDPATKKGKNEIVGRLSKENPKIVDKWGDSLSPAERKEVTAFIDGSVTTLKLKGELAARTLTEQMALAESWFSTHTGGDARMLAASLVPAWTRLRNSLKKHSLAE